MKPASSTLVLVLAYATTPACGGGSGLPASRQEASAPDRGPTSDNRDFGPGAQADVFRASDPPPSSPDTKLPPDTVDTKADDALLVADTFDGLSADRRQLQPNDALVPDDVTVRAELPDVVFPDAFPPATPDASPPKDVIVSDSLAPAPGFPKGVDVYANKDLAGGADAQCTAGTPGWLDVVRTTLAEDQKCLVDTDCFYVSFSDPCGMVCVFPLNKYRMGEFAARLTGYASAKCSTCPSAAGSAPCQAPRDVRCNSGLCEYVPS